MKKLIAPALLAVLALTGCSATATPAPSATAPAPPALTIAKPTEAQKTALMADLAKVNPQFEGTRTLISASLACRTILKGSRSRHRS
ncbi:hypothetical protein [Pseudarthrobacter chlorophenolicus]|uniref:hypothetical protein n=1 Tax=Pseudarthrobacter chlorophenolicus TaxID=85085 RepID=UPI0008894FF3|nr:hypothetical protein [Pseudarthrobacter chlorophenolicus]SDQ21232.1 hypothetical protein SAMN04489738_0774 [Pseudarthrobacter chlorophenolicus]